MLYTNDYRKVAQDIVIFLQSMNRSEREKYLDDLRDKVLSNRHRIDNSYPVPEIQYGIPCTKIGRNNLEGMDKHSGWRALYSMIVVQAMRDFVYSPNEVDKLEPLIWLVFDGWIYAEENGISQDQYFHNLLNHQDRWRKIIANGHAISGLRRKRSQNPGR